MLRVQVREQVHAIMRKRACIDDRTEAHTKGMRFHSICYCEHEHYRLVLLYDEICLKKVGCPRQAQRQDKQCTCSTCSAVGALLGSCSYSWHGHPLVNIQHHHKHLCCCLRMQQTQHHEDDVLGNHSDIDVRQAPILSHDWYHTSTLPCLTLSSNQTTGHSRYLRVTPAW